MSEESPDDTRRRGSGDAAGHEGGRIVFVPGPIGHLADITIRALDELRAADVIACEDTRHSRRLLDRYEIRARLVSLHEHNEAARSAQLIEDARAGKVIAVLTDAGCPGISDPGGRLLQACLRASIPYRVLPGPTAVTVGLFGSGLFAGAFYFGGFLPPKSGRREREIRRALERDETSVYFEAPHRLLKSLALLAALEPGRPVCVARELTKAFEEFRRGTAAEVLAHFENRPPKGEITLVIAGRDLPPWISLPGQDPPPRDRET